MTGGALQRSLASGVDESKGVVQAGNVTEVHRTRDEVVAGLQDEVVRSYADHFKVTEDVARDHLVAQGRAPGIGLVLEDRWPEAIVEVWFDNGPGEWVVVASPAAPAEEIAEAFHREGLSDDYRLETVAFTRGDYESATGNLRAALDSQIRAQAVSVEPGGAVVRVLVSPDIAPDDDAAVDAAIEKERARVDVPILRELSNLEPPEPQVSCVFPHCDTMIGGIQIQCQQAGNNCVGGTGVCSLSFEVLLAQQVMFLTAGHCALNSWGNGQAVYARGTPWGNLYRVADHMYVGSYDYVEGDWAVVRDVLPGVPRFGGWHDWTGTPSNANPSHYWYQGKPSIGTWVCKSAAVTALSCGTITSHGYYANYGAPTLIGPLLKIDPMVGCDGDSGGAVWQSPDIAVGVHSGGTSPCGQPSYATPTGNVNAWALNNGYTFSVISG